MRQIEAKAVISASDRTGNAFASVAAKVRRLESASSRVSQASSAVARSGSAALSMLGRLAAPAALAAGAYAATKNFAAYDRQLSHLANTAGASGDQMVTLRKEIDATSREVAETPDQVLRGSQIFVAALGDIDLATKATRATARAAKAFGTDIEEQAAAGIAVVQNLGIAVEKLNRANEIMGAGANIGMFEAKDMAKHMPGIAAAAKELKVAGEVGLGKLVTHLEVVRTATGESAQAANDFYNLLSKIVAPTTIKNVAELAEEQGKNIDLMKEIEKGYKNGADGVETFLRVVRDLSKGSPEKLKKLVPDMEAGRALTALLSQYDQLNSKMKTVMDSAGLVDKAFKRVMTDAQSSFDKLAASWDRLMKVVGEKTMIKEGAGVIADFLDNTSNIMEMSPKERDAFYAEGEKRFNREMQELDADALRDKVRAAEKADSKRPSAIDVEIADLKRGKASPIWQSGAGRPAVTPADQRRIKALEQERDKLRAGASEKTRALRMQLFEMEQRLRLLDNPPPGLDLSGIVPRRPADVEDRWLQRSAPLETMPKRKSAPLPKPDPRGRPVMLAPVGDDGGGFGSTVKAVVEGPVTATVSGQANVQVSVTVEASPQLLATVQRAEAASMKLNSAPTGKSMAGAGRSAGAGDAYDF